MKIAAPTSKSIVLTVVLALLSSFAVPVFGQKRGRAPQKTSVSRAAGLVEEANKLADERKYPEAIDAYKLAIRLDVNYAPARDAAERRSGAADRLAPGTLNRRQ